ncbi:MAG: deoxyribodipyrimidine photo-lyase, partial [Planctomycetota bacterium]
APLAVPRLSAFAQVVACDDLDEWSLTPHAPDGAAAFDDTWTPGEDGAMQAFERFIMQQRVDTYEADRDRPGVEGTSRLSPHLRSGEISPRQLWAAIHEHPARDGAAKFLAEVGWREFCYHLLFHVNDLTTTNFRADFARMPWLYDRAVLRAWQRGRTGYPLVDAGMRQLWQTGWMHNRVRMVVASFLTKHLLHDWRHGEAWFWDTLVDADRANNVCGWQWVAGCGADAAPYFRVFNPTAQSTRFDPQGVYLRRWLPELAALPDRWIHEPSSAPAGVLREAGVVPGTTYPRPIVEHGAARQRALDAWATIRG